MEGRTVFPLFGVSGGISSSLVMYIMETPPKSAQFGYDLGRAGLHEEDGGRWYCIEVPYNATPEILEGAVKVAVEALSR